MKYFCIFLILLSFAGHSSFNPSEDRIENPIGAVLKVSNRLEKLFQEDSFLTQVSELSPDLAEQLKYGFEVEIRTELISDDMIAQYADGVITIDTRFIFQADPFHASSLCHELAHHYGFGHTDEDYYESIPYLFGEICRIEYTKIYWYSWGGVILTTEQAQTYLETGRL